MVDPHDDPPPHERILTAALHLLDAGGEDAVSTRAVGARAGVQAPTIYRLFGDKQGLLEAAVERGYADWVTAKGSRAVVEDPVEALRAGWDGAVQFGIDHPAMYRIACARSTRSPALADGHELTRAMISRIAAAGRLRVSEAQALALVQASARGVTLALLDPSPTPTAAQDLSVMAREAMIVAITTDTPPRHDDTLRSAAAAVYARLTDAIELRPAEQALMAEWLERIASSPAGLHPPHPGQAPSSSSPSSSSPSPSSPSSSLPPPRVKKSKGSKQSKRAR